MRIVLSALKCQKTLRFNILCVLILTLCSIGCGNKGGSMLLRDCKALSATMDQADRLMNDNPAQAYSLLDSIDRRRLWSRGNKALFALLYTEAQYKNYQPIESDSLIMTSVKYYSHSKNPELLFRSYYTLGCVYTDMHCYPDAIVAFTQADMLNDYCTDQFRKGMLYLRMGDVFYDTYDYSRAETYYLKAVDYFGLTDRDYYVWCAKGMVADCKAQMGDYKGAIALCDLVNDWAMSVDSLSLLKTYMTYKMAFLVYDNNLADARQMYDTIKQKYGLPCDNPEFINLFARFYIETDQFDNARKILDKAWGVSSDSANLYYAESLLHQKTGQPDSAMYYYRQSMNLNKQAVVKVLHQPVMGAQRDYYRTMTELEALKIRNHITIFVATFIIMLLIIVATVLLLINHKRKTKEQMRANIDAINELTARDSISKTRIQLLNLKVREMMRKQYAMPDYLYTRYYEQTDDNRKAEQLYKVVKKQIDDFTSTPNIARLDQMLKDTFGGLIEKLFSPRLGLQDKEQMLLRLVLTDISAKSMAAILNDTNQNINQRKKRLLEKIGRLDAGLLVELNAALNS